MKALKIIFLVITAVFWVPFWILWKIFKFCRKYGITFKTKDGW